MAATAAQAEDKLAVVFNAGAQTDYVFRGVSQTNGHGSAFAGVDATYGQAYAGAWTSNVNFRPFGDSSTIEEIDLYGGWRPTVGTVSLDLGVQYYGYADQPHGVTVDYTEVYAKATKPFGKATLGASVYYSPQFTDHTGNAWYTEVNAAYPITKTLGASAALGHQEIEAGGSYTTWNAGLTYALTDHFSIDGRYWDTDKHSFGKPYDARAVLAIKATFP